MSICTLAPVLCNAQSDAYNESDPLPHAHLDSGVHRTQTNADHHKLHTLLNALVTSPGILQQQRALHEQGGAALDGCLGKDSQPHRRCGPALLERNTRVKPSFDGGGVGENTNQVAKGHTYLSRIGNLKC